MVTGGHGETEPWFLDTTEVYQDNVWRTVAGKLPVPVASLRAATVNNRVLLFGNNYQSMCVLFLI